MVGLDNYYILTQPVLRNGCVSTSPYQSICVSIFISYLLQQESKTGNGKILLGYANLARVTRLQGYMYNVHIWVLEIRTQ